MSVMHSNRSCDGASSEFCRFCSVVRRQRLETTSGATARPTAAAAAAAASSAAEEHIDEDAAELLTDKTVDEKVDG